MHESNIKKPLLAAITNREKRTYPDTFILERIHSAQSFAVETFNNFMMEQCIEYLEK